MVAVSVIGGGNWGNKVVDKLYHTSPELDSISQKNYVGPNTNKMQLDFTISANWT
jgi:hypothetical protein